MNNILLMDNYSEKQSHEALMLNLPILLEYAKFIRAIPRNSTHCRPKLNSQTNYFPQTPIKKHLSEGLASKPLASFGGGTSPPHPVRAFGSFGETTPGSVTERIGTKEIGA